ncbi:MAG: hypothetical protein RL026_1819 [Pseudomonadota bacterium]|jgi:hypothetical protein
MAVERPSPITDLPRVQEAVVPLAELDATLRAAQAPMVLRQLAADWPLVAAGLQGAAAAQRYLLAHRRDRSFVANIGRPGGGDRLFYDAGMNVNFQTARGRLEDFFDAMAAGVDDPQAPLVYLSSIDIRGHFSGLAEANPLPLGARQPVESIWIGSRTCIPAHNDVPDNLAVCAVGRRRFTLLPPSQFENLYAGPLENTPAGRPVSLVDFRDPDFAAHPRFRQALAQAQVAELQPGDAVYIPTMWWHHVEGQEAFNVLVNYWWRDVPHYLGKPEDALLHAILALRDLPAAEKTHWQDLLNHYVFDNGADVTAHIPEAARGILAPLDDATAGRIRARLLRSLSR